MTEAGLSKLFPQQVAQSTQSLTVEDIQYYFESEVTEENGIPTGQHCVINATTNFKGEAFLKQGGANFWSSLLYPILNYMLAILWSSCHTF